MTKTHKFPSQAAFARLDHLRALRLDNNALKDINGLVASAANLRWLNVSANSLQGRKFMSCI